MTPPVFLRFPAACIMSVLFPIPGSPPIRTVDPTTTPPPSTRSNSPMPVVTRTVSFSLTEPRVTAREDVPPAECVLRFSGAAETSTRVFQLPHIGQQPIHFTVSYPHSPQTNFVFSFIKNLPQPFFRFAVFERFFGISEQPFYSGGRAYLIMSRSREVTSIHIT